jgi:hypothetical protein
VIADLVRATLGPSEAIGDDSVTTALEAAAGVGRLLVASGHLDAHPLVLVAPPVHLSISTVSGSQALGLELPVAVPGGASASEWTLYLPTPDPLLNAVQTVADAHANLSAEEAPAEALVAPAAGIDREALARRMVRRP